MDAKTSMWKVGSWNSMEELLLCDKFSSNGEFVAPSKEILGDENQLTLEGLDRLEGLLDEFLGVSTTKDVGKPEPKNFLDDEDFFPEWVETKIDFSLLDNLDNSNLDKLLDDPNMVMVEDKPLKFKLDNSEEKLGHPLLGRNINGMNILGNEAPNSTTYSYPNSPEGIVPDVSAPCSPVSAPSFGSIMDQNCPSPNLNQLCSTSTTFTIILPEGKLAGLLAQTDNVLELKLFTANPVNGMENSSEFNMQDDSLPIAEVSITNDFEGILKDKQDLQKNQESNKKGPRGRKRKNMEEFQLGCTNSSEEQPPAVPKQRKERKRMQNKDAATRYRQKKRAQSDAIGEVEEQLLSENKELKDKAQQLSTEITYLKGLMREMFKARGLLK